MKRACNYFISKVMVVRAYEFHSTVKKIIAV